MKFLIVTHAIHKYDNKKLYAYEPYVREMNLWGKYLHEIIVLAPLSNQEITPIETSYNNTNIKLIQIPSFDIKSAKNSLKALLLIPHIFSQIFKLMRLAEHIHLRCPGNIGLLGCFAQILFPKKPKTVKYAGNWDPKSKQPFSYRLQKKILSNTFLTRNCKVLVYGNWNNQSKNIVPFFTASYTNKEIEDTPKKSLQSKIKFIFVGNFSDGKRPLLSVKVVEELIKNKVENVELNMYGNGVEFNAVKEYITDKKLDNHIFLHGNQQKDVVKKAYQKSHFLIFISKSEGWPKVVAEAMFWRCLPIASKVSCVEDMLGFGKRGTVLEPSCNEKDVVLIIKNYLKNELEYQEKVFMAKQWSQQYTLDKFDIEIKNLL